MGEVMNKEKSCGAVVVRKTKDTILYLIVMHNKGHYSFPKGHVEEGETEEETAVREIKEETNIDVSIDTGFRKVNTYSPKPMVIKDVVFFVGEALTYDAVPQESEIKKVLFLDYATAYDTLSYEKDKAILKEANIYIMNKIKE